MPYIDPNLRKQLDPEINMLKYRIRDMNHEQFHELDGILNYCITKLLKDLLELSGPPQYTKYNTVVGLLECIKQEFYARKVAPYEVRKMEKNGDVY